MCPSQFQSPTAEARRMGRRLDGASPPRDTSRDAKHGDRCGMNPGDHSPELAEARRRLVELETLEAERARAAKLQDALFRIAELAGSARDLQEFYRAIHAVVGELIDARNFYLALYDEERQLISWPYYVDEIDKDLPDPNRWEQFGS